MPYIIAQFMEVSFVLSRGWVHAPVSNLERGGSKANRKSTVLRKNAEDQSQLAQLQVRAFRAIQLI